MGRYEEAVAQYQEALRITPGDAGVHKNLGLALESLGRPQEAAPHFQEALRIKAGQD